MVRKHIKFYEEASMCEKRSNEYLHKHVKNLDV